MKEVKHTFSKSERLTNKKVIKELFENGSSFFLYPFKVKYVFGTHEAFTPPQIVITVPKRIFKRAVHRNMVKRRCREAYRLNNEELKTFCRINNVSLEIVFIYVGKRIELYRLIDSSVKNTLNRIQSDYERKN